MRHTNRLTKTRMDTAHHRGFNFTEQMRRLCDDITTRSPELAHIQFERVAVAFSQTRKRTSYGLYASLTPMRFEGGATEGTRRGRKYAVQRLLDLEGRELLYILTFYLPRFQDLDFEEKLTTIFHELWHISSDFNGDLRRHSGRCFAHTHSQKQYDAEMRQLALSWLDKSPPASLYAFLKHTFNQLYLVHGNVVGTRIPRPKLLPVD